MSGGIGRDTLNVDDSGDTEDNTATVYDTLITGLGMNGEIDYGNFEQLNIGMGSGNDILSIESTHQKTTSVNTTAGKDTVNVENISGETKVQLGVDDDTANIGDINQQMDNINAMLSIFADACNDVLNIDDSGDIQNNTATVNTNQITGLGMSSKIDYSNIETLKMWLGLGKDVISIDSLSADTEIHTGLTEDLVITENLSLLAAQLIVDNQRKNQKGEEEALGQEI